MRRIFDIISSNGIIVLVFFIAIIGMNYVVMTLELSGPFNDGSLLSLTFSDAGDSFAQLYGLILMIAFYVSIVPIILAIISLIRKRKRGFIFAGLVFLVLDAALLVFQILGGFIPNIGAALIIVCLVLALIALIFSLMLKFNTDILDEDNSIDEEVVEKEPVLFEKTKATFTMLILDIVSVVVFVSVFFVPLFIGISNSSTHYFIMMNVLFTSETSIIVVITFFVYLIILFITVMLLMNTIAVYRSSDDRFIKQSKRLIKIMFLAVSGFFIAGLVIKIMSSIYAEQEILIVSYIPMLPMLIVYFYNSMLIGKMKGHELQEKKLRIPFFNIEPLVFLVLITLVTIGMLFLPIIRVNVGSMTYANQISMTGIELLTDYTELDGGYQMLAFVLHVMLLVVGFGLVVAIAAYLSKSKMFHQVVKTAAFTNVFFVFLVSVSGYYFMIAKEINLELLRNLIDHYNAGFIIDPELYDYEIKTDTTFALGGSVAVLIIMFARRVFDRDEMPSLSPGFGQFAATDSISGTDTDYTQTEKTQVDFDPCYSFTEVDLQESDFIVDLQQRQEYAPEEASLTSLTQFVVDYARNSRLHLSYTRSKIAAFIAGLGASKLSILQGMSGTGKTSLPKIFSEAILGNCEIVEVESSWKDKNELLGYYNEFSLKYTPKKFTIALYKATMNQDIFTFILLDEMNLSRIEYYFSDFLSLMEHEEDHRTIKLVNLKLFRQEEGEEVEYVALNKGHTLKVPPNVWFLGTANRDESTFVISDKVYDRATTMNFTKRAPKVRDYSDPIPKRFYDYHTINTLLEDAKAKGTFDAEQSDIIKAIEVLLSPYNISFGNRILKQIEDFVNIYVECFEGENVESEAVETILLSKVVAKLEIKTIEDKDQLQLEFEKLNLHQCAEFIKLLDDE